MKTTIYVILFLVVLRSYAQKSSYPFIEGGVASFSADFDNFKKMTAKPAFATSYRLGVGRTVVRNDYLITSTLLAGFESIKFSLSHGSTTLPYSHKIIYPNFCLQQGFGGFLSKNASFHFNVMVCYNGGVAIFNSFPDTVPYLEPNVTFDAPSNFWDFRIGIAIEKAVYDNKFRLVFGCDASLSKRQLNVKLNNGYLKDNNVYNIQYSIVCLKLAVCFNLKRRE